MDSAEEEPDVPLHHLRPFGTGLKRKRVAFVPASSTLETVTTSATPAPSKSIGDLYLSMVMPKGAKTVAEAEAEAGGELGLDKAEPQRLCPVCKLPLSQSPENPKSHETSIVHQVCLEHSHPPSSVDRSRMGLAYLQSYGWDPDSREGLGVEGQGIQHPIKVKPKEDTLGIGAVVPSDVKDRRVEKPVTLDAKKIRKKAAEEKKRHEELTRQFYGNPDLEKYLGGS